MINKEIMNELYFLVRDEGKRLSNYEINQIKENLLNEYKEEIFMESIFCLAFGSKYFQENPEDLDRILQWDLDDYDLGQVIDAMKYTGLTKNYLDFLFGIISFDRFSSDWDYSTISAMNTVAHYIYDNKRLDIFEKFKLVFYYNVSLLNKSELKSKEVSYFRFFFSALLYSKYGKKSINMSFDAVECIRSEKYREILERD